MDQNREQICKFYINMGNCKHNKTANHWHYCQSCELYCPKEKDNVLNIKRKLTHLKRVIIKRLGT